MREALHLHGVGYQRHGTALVAGLDARFERGGLHVLVGPNGAGKTTLLKLAAGLLTPSQGRVSLDGVDFAAPLARARQLAYLPQFQSVAWPLLAADVVALGLLPEGPLPAEEQRARVAAALDKCRAAPLAARRVTDLSGGELARVMLARLLVSRAQFLLLDEPVQSLDPGSALALLDILQAEAASGRGIVMVLHELNLAARYADTGWLMHGGRLVAHGEPGDVFTPSQLRPIFDAEFQQIGDHVMATGYLQNR